MLLNKFGFVLVFFVLIAFGCGRHKIDTCHCERCMDVKTGQLIIAGFKGSAPSAYICDAIEKHHISGVVYFDVDLSGNMGRRNVDSPAQLAALSAALQRLSPHSPLLICVDQEGGNVNRLKAEYGFDQTVSAAYLGRLNCADSTRKYAAATARTLALAGVNVDFAPCVDLAINPENPIVALKERSFSVNADTTVTHAAIWIEELHKMGVLTSLKHFPGHGSSQTDSHLGLTDITDCWGADELTPYKRLIDGGYNDMVMVGHLINRNVDTLPASLSANFIKGILRDRLGFSGVVITDDMNMGAIVNHYSLERSLILALNSGVDMIILGNNGAVFEPDLVSRAHGFIKRAVSRGDISPSTIDSSYARVCALKSTL